MHPHPFTSVVEKFMKYKVGDSLKVKMKHGGWVVGEIKFTKKLNDGRMFYYIHPQRLYKDGKIQPAEQFVNRSRLMCIPAYVEGLIYE